MCLCVITSEKQERLQNEKTIHVFFFKEKKITISVSTQAYEGGISFKHQETEAWEMMQLV